jgi:hypothetical protein
VRSIFSWCAVAVLALVAFPARGQILTEIPGSPFTFQTAVNSNVVRVGPGDRILFVASQGTVGPMLDDGAVTSLAIAADGSLSWIDTERAGIHPCGIAVNPAGNRLYVASWHSLHVYAVAPDGALAPLQTLSTGSSPYNGIEYVALPGGDFVYVNENASPVNQIAAYAVAPDGQLSDIGRFQTGDEGSTSGLYAPPRLLLGGAGRLYAGNASSVSVFDIAADGSLALVPRAPFPLPSAPSVIPRPGEPSIPPAPSLAMDPSGHSLFAGLGRDVAQMAIAPDGGLSVEGVYTAEDVTYPNTAIAVHPSGLHLVAAYGSAGVRVWEVGAFGPPVFAIGPSAGTGLDFNESGTLLFGGRAQGQEIRVRVYRFGAPDSPHVACVGSPAERRVLQADATACVVTVDAANRLAGGCSGAASCTFDGRLALPLGLGSADILVTATSSSGATASCTSHVDVVDVNAPTISMAPSPAVLWPPDHRLVPVDPRVVAWDACDPEPAIACDASSSEAENGLGDGDTARDASWSAAGFLLRAERSGASAGRTYALTCTATDDSGNAASASASVAVPHDRRR